MYLQEHSSSPTNAYSTLSSPQKPTLVWRTADKTFYSVLSLESSPSVPLWQYLPYHLPTVMGPFYWSCPHWQDTTIQWQESKIPWHKTLLLWQGTSPTSIHSPVNSDTCWKRRLDNRDIAIKRRLDNRKILSMIELPLLPLGNWIKRKAQLSFCLQIKDRLSMAVNRGTHRSSREGTAQSVEHLPLTLWGRSGFEIRGDITRGISISGSTKRTHVLQIFFF